MSEELNPCPFCGERGMIAATLDDTFRPMCVVDACCTLEGYGTRAEAIAAWNTRVADRVSTPNPVVAHETVKTSDKLRDAVEVIQRIAKASATFAHHAGVGGMETAGSIVSFLAANPHRIPDFMAGGSIIDWPIGWHTAGCLSWHGMDGKIHHPAELEQAQ